MSKKIFSQANLQKIVAKLGMPGIRFWHAYVYRVNRGKWPNFKHPTDLSEMILASMNKKDFVKNAIYADKWKVREYIQSKGLGDILLDVYGAWDKAEDIDFNALPEKFALKPNNGSGGHFFCKDKSKIDIPSVRKQMNQSIILDRLGYHFEPHYEKIEPKIYAEELIDTGTDAWPTDYKFTCVNGVIGDVFVCCERETGTTKYITLDTDWNVLPYTKKEYMPDFIPEKPKHLDRMIEIAKMLSADFDIVRVDLYEYKDKVYFSELTFSPWGGYMYSYNQDGLNKLGELYYKTKQKKATH